MGTAGHIDHGKTSLVKMLTNTDCDTHKEEKARGITINLGFTFLNLPGGDTIGIIDVPGHRDFINTMISGACGIDMVLLIIAADSGIMPQTLEHMNIVSALGIKKGVVALTKTDLVDEDLLDIAESEVADLLSATPLRESPVVRVSNITGQGKDDLIEAIEMTISEMEERDRGRLFRMYIDRIFTVKGMGSVVTGSVLGGSLAAGQEVFLLPADKQKLKVRSLERYGKEVNQVVAGDRAAVNLTGLKNKDFARGMIISEKMIEPTVMVDCLVRLFDTARAKLPVWSEVAFITGTFECKARMHLLNSESLAAGEEAIVQLHLRKPASLMNKDRFILRNSSEDQTIGGGYIIDPAPLHHRKRTPELITGLTRLCRNILAEDNTGELIMMELKRELKPFPITEIAEKLNLEVIDILVVAQTLNRVKLYGTDENTLLVGSDYDNVFRKKIIDALRQYHSDNPLFAEGLDAEEIAGKLVLRKSREGRLFTESLLNQMREENLVEPAGKSWILAGHKPHFDRKTLEAMEWLENEIVQYGRERTSVSELEEKAVIMNIPRHRIKTCLSFLASGGKIKLSQNDYIHTSILTIVRADVLKHLLTREDGMSYSEFKEIVGGTKRFRSLIIEILEAEKSVLTEKGTGQELRLFLTNNGRKSICQNHG